MPRTRRKFKIPFLKFRINKHTLLNVIGFLFVAASFILLLSFAKNFFPGDEGQLLSDINQIFLGRFGGLSILLPFILLLFSAHFFNTKKLRFVKFNVTIGLIFMTLSLLGFFQSGEYGMLIYNNLGLDFSITGAIFILFTVFIIGLILFLDTSVDVFFIFVWRLLKGIFSFFNRYLFRSLSEKPEKKEKGKKEQEEYITDKRFQDKQKSITTHAVMQPTIMSKGISIKPLPYSSKTAWIYPPVSLLADVVQREADRGDVNKNAHTLEKTLDSFGIRAKVVEVNKGPAVTQYALSITLGTKLSRITALSNDLALAIAARTGLVRIEAPIPGRSLVGIEIPNIKPEIVTLKKLLGSPIFSNNPDPLLVPLGLDVSGQPQAASINNMPHVLIAGATGSGKSVILNAWICTFLFRTKPEDLRMILVDPKRVELTPYNGIPHLWTEVIVEPDKIISALKWTVSEMENRYKEFAKVGVRNLEGYNVLEGVEKKPYTIFVIDELADIMIFAASEAEELITRIAQMARATGIHLILATQRPSVDVITGLMKANIPTRVAFSVSSMIDSRVIIDMPGAEKLLGKGDMLFLPPDQAKPRRIQGPFITEKEVVNLVRFLKSQVPEVHYTEEVTQQEVAVGIGGRGGTMVVDGKEQDKLFNQALEVIMQDGKASASYLQRRLSIGYSRAARILDQLSAAGYVSQGQGSKPRDILKRPVLQNSEQI